MDAIGIIQDFSKTPTDSGDSSETGERTKRDSSRSRQPRKTRVTDENETRKAS